MMLLSLLLTTVIAPVSARSDPESFILGVVPHLPPAQTHRDWAPFAERLSREVGARIVVKVYRNLPEFESDIMRGGPDLACLNPYQQVVAKKTQGYQPLVREGRLGLSGSLVVRRDSPIQSINDLNGKVIAFPDPNAFAASLYMRALLHERFKISFTPRYLGSHSNVYRHVLHELVEAGGGVNVMLKLEPPEARNNLRILYETPSVSPHPLSAHPRVTPGLRAAIVRAVENMTKDPAGQALLTAVEMPNPVVADFARDYAPLQRLHLEKYFASGHTATP